MYPVSQLHKAMNIISTTIYVTIDIDIDIDI
jgi:hypothetical protein